MIVLHPLENLQLNEKALDGVFVDFTMSPE
jgi:hypothetical protein